MIKEAGKNIIIELVFTIVLLFTFSVTYLYI